MKFSHLPGEKLSLRVRPTDRVAFRDLLGKGNPTARVKGIEPTHAFGEFGVALRDDYINVRAIESKDALRLNDALLHGRALLAQVSDLGDDDGATLSIAFFTGGVLDLDEVEIGVDEYVLRGARRIGRVAGRQAYDWLAERFVYGDGDDYFFFYSAGPAIEGAIAADDAEEARGAIAPEATEVDDSGESSRAGVHLSRAPRAEQSVINSLMVVGSDVRFVATDTPVGHGQSIYVATKLTERPAGLDRTVRLARGRLRFVDWTEAGQIQIRARAQLASLTQDESSYLRKWDEFGDVEGELLLGEARAFGTVRFASPVENRDGTVTVQIADAPDSAFEALRNGIVEAVDLVDTEPPYLLNPAMTFEEFSRQIAEGATGDPRSRRDRDRTSGTSISIRSFDNESLRVTLNTERLPPGGTLVLSLQGEITQIRRRHAARRAILTGQSANPQLGVLIEERGEITSLRSPQKVAPLTAYVQDKVFRNAPTVMQKRAIAVALNTPDIALIQGPPGTGKTTVIAAILERLNEEATKAGRSLKGRVLLTGFQHDAVENMIDRISLNAIPVPKFGTRGGTEDGATAFERNLEDWCKQIADELRERNPQFADIEHEAGIRDQYQQYLRAPSRRLALALTTRINDLGVSIVGEQLARTASQLLQRLQGEESTSTSDPSSGPIAAVRRLRVRPESFADDGPERAEDALIDLDNYLTDHEHRILDNASLWTSSRGIPPFLDQLGEVKRALMRRLTAPPEFRVEKRNDEVVSLGGQVLDRLRAHGHGASDRKSAVLAQFLAELETNPWGMVDAVSEYSYAFAATVQQSVNREMQKRKGLSADDTPDLEYDYVIVDEAARVSPRDLMIPMSQGKRIILVGDHRQLPHLIDESVARSMEAGEAGPTESEWLKRSMFDYLFAERLKSLELADGIERRVTLDKQFRMHPSLGRFVSRNFYERFDAGERFDSGLPHSHFAHNLPGTENHPAMWIDVPGDRGPARRSGTSWTRQAEADRITEQLRTWIQSQEGQGLTYGVIAFYKAQAELIRRQLRQQLGDIVDDERRIRVGTVDSFQGMEFDVVFLSVVRTVPPNWKPRSDDSSVNARGLFGHLCLYNRLNVSMSRQKRLLVAVGDSALIHHTLAAEYIPGLVDFHRLASEAAIVPPPVTAPASPAVSPRSPEQAGTPVVPPTPAEPAAEDARQGIIARLLGRRRGET